MRLLWTALVVLEEAIAESGSWNPFRGDIVAFQSSRKWLSAVAILVCLGAYILIYIIYCLGAAIACSQAPIKQAAYLLPVFFTFAAAGRWLGAALATLNHLK